MRSSICCTAASLGSPLFKRISLAAAGLTRFSPGARYGLRFCRAGAVGSAPLFGLSRETFICELLLSCVPSGAAVQRKGTPGLGKTEIVPEWDFGERIAFRPGVDSKAGFSSVHRRTTGALVFSCAQTRTKAAAITAFSVLLLPARLG
jgi:hypothetical protein